MLPLAEVTGGSIALLAGIGMMTCMLLMRAQKQFRKSAPHGAKASPPKSSELCDSAASARTQRAAQVEVQGWQVKMHETARELTAQLDTKISMLQVLLADAQQQAVRLEQALDRAQSALADERGGTANPPANQAAGLSLAGPHIATRTTRGSQRPYKDIFALADAGHSSSSIAQRLSAPIGEIDLILGLRRELQPPAGS